jgi:hypothetical protein
MAQQPEVQSEEARVAALSRGATHGASATGQAQRASDDAVRLKGEPRGSTVEINGAPEGGDFGSGTASEPKGLQAEPAAFTPSGTIPSGMVSSPGGFVPVSAVPEREREARLQTTLGKTSIGDRRELLAEEELEGLDAPTLRAIGHQRGYKMPEQAGSRRMRAEFLRAQNDDSSLKPQKKGLASKVREVVGR